MREIKFRGKSYSWHYGDLIHDSCNGRELIFIDNNAERTRHSVDKDTVGQYTGLCDSDGREIYEGDIVEATLKDKSFIKRFHMDETVTGEISFDGAWWLGEWNALWRLPRYYDLTVIGNIHDNPELLEVEA